jgi:hypothetical protein
MRDGTNLASWHRVVAVVVGSGGGCGSVSCSGDGGGCGSDLDKHPCLPE